VNKNHPFVKAASNLVSDGIDVLFGALGNTIKQEVGLPNRRPAVLLRAGGLRPAVDELEEVMDYPACWNREETLAVLTVPHESRQWKFIAGDHGDLVEILLPVNVRFPPSQVPVKLAVHLLTLNTRMPFGGFDLFPSEGSLSLNCRASIPADAVTGELLYTTIHIMVREVAALYDQFNL
jgi:hypothetical protein